MPEMEGCGERAERSPVDRRRRERAHAGVEAGRAGNARGRPAALRTMLGGTSLGAVDCLAREHRVAARGEGGLVARSRKAARWSLLRCVLEKSKTDAALLEREPREPIGLGAKRRDRRAGVGGAGFAEGRPLRSLVTWRVMGMRKRDA